MILDTNLQSGGTNKAGTNKGTEFTTLSSGEACHWKKEGSVVLKFSRVPSCLEVKPRENMSNAKTDHYMGYSQCQNSMRPIWTSKAVLTEDEKGDRNKPTRRTIRIALQWLAKDCRSGDSLVFFFSGHGLRHPERVRGDEADGYDESIRSVDFVEEGCILDSEINETIVCLFPKGVTLHAIVDACHSGTVLDLPYQYDI